MEVGDDRWANRAWPWDHWFTAYYPYEVSAGAGAAPDGLRGPNGDVGNPNPTVVGSGRERRGVKP